jgi:hypothetical protein
MSHWLKHCELLKPHLHEVRYERLVSDFEKEARHLAATLGLPWHEAMGKPEAHARSRDYLPTMSYAEAVQPVGKGAVGRWRHYARPFASVLPQLQPYLAHWHYSATGE